MNNCRRAILVSCCGGEHPPVLHEVDFMALNGHRYRTRWSVARARDKENGRLQNPRLALYNLDKEEEEQGDAFRSASPYYDLIGLTFEQFTRSVLLAQNDFPLS